MLSPQTLERVSVSYRKGYYDGYDGKPQHAREPLDITDTGSPHLKPFANHDYEAGYKAGANDRKWSLK